MKLKDRRKCYLTVAASGDVTIKQNGETIEPVKGSDNTECYNVIRGVPCEFSEEGAILLELQNGGVTYFQIELHDGSGTFTPLYDQNEAVVSEE